MYRGFRDGKNSRRSDKLHRVHPVNYRVIFEHLQIAARQANRSSFKEITLQSLQASSTAPTTYVANDVVRRQMRHVSDVCEKFSIGEEAKQEFYSPNYPDNYPNLTECVKVLKGEQTSAFASLLPTVEIIR